MTDSYLERVKREVLRARAFQKDLDAITYTGTCGWCGRDTVCSVGEPFMVEVSHKPLHIRQGTRDRVCLECYGDFIKFIAERRSS